MVAGTTSVGVALSSSLVKRGHSNPLSLRARKLRVLLRPLFSLSAYGQVSALLWPLFDG
jgi:hypothetical protein